jgi:hypothetical protein
MYFEIYQEGLLTGILSGTSSTAGQWRWHFKSGNHQPLTHGKLSQQARLRECGLTC